MQLTFNDTIRALFSVMPVIGMHWCHRKISWNEKVRENSVVAIKGSFSSWPSQHIFPWDGRKNFSLQIELYVARRFFFYSWDFLETQAKEISWCVEEIFHFKTNLLFALEKCDRHKVTQNSVFILPNIFRSTASFANIKQLPYRKCFARLSCW